MPVTVANVSHPNQNTWEGEFLGQKARVIDVTFDSSYDNTNGEVITAASLGLQSIYGVFPLTQAYKAASDLASVVVPVVNAAQTQVALRVFEADGGATGQAPLDEAANTTDYSNYVVRLCVLGV